MRPTTSKGVLTLGALVAVAMAGVLTTGGPTPQASGASGAATSKTYPTLHKTITVDGLDIFYREAGPQTAPTILLLHGFPTSSHMFRNLIPALADTFHLVAPDYPGFRPQRHAPGGRVRLHVR
jgi:alpha/beta hydrolase fold